MPQRNIWEDIGGCAVPRHWMGAWLNYRKLASLQQLPNSDYRAQLAGLYPMDYGFTFLLNPQESGDQRATIMRNWVLYGMVCNATAESGGDEPVPVGSSFQAQIYIGKYKQGTSLSDRPMAGADDFGGQNAVSIPGSPANGMLVRWFRTPLWIPPQTPILIRVQNLNATPATQNQIEIVLQGCGD